MPPRPGTNLNFQVNCSNTIQHNDTLISYMLQSNSAEIVKSSFSVINHYICLRTGNLLVEYKAVVCHLQLSKMHTQVFVVGRVPWHYVAWYHAVCKWTCVFITGTSYIRGQALPAAPWAHYVLNLN